MFNKFNEAVAPEDLVVGSEHNIGVYECYTHVTDHVHK